MTTDPQPAVWIDGDPLMEAIAAAVWERCEQHDSGLVVDDPRNIAAVAASVAVSSAAAQSAPADRAADVASCPGRELDPNPCRCPCYGCKHHCSAHNPDEVPDSESAPAETALRDRIRRAVCEAEGFAWDSDMLEPDEYGDHADMILAALFGPIPAGTDVATWTAIRAIQLMNEAGQQRDAAVSATVDRAAEECVCAPDLCHAPCPYCPACTAKQQPTEANQ